MVARITTLLFSLPNSEEKREKQTSKIKHCFQCLNVSNNNI